MQVRFLPGVQWHTRLMRGIIGVMNKFKYQVKLTVVVEAFDESDAWEALQDAFGVGEELGVTVTNCEYREKK